MVNFLTFLLFTGLVAFIAWRYTRDDDLSTAEGYFLGGRSLVGPVICGSLMLTNLSTEHIVGMNGGAFREGVLIAAWETLAAFAAIAMALFFLPRYLQSGFTTLPQYLEQRYDHGTRLITAMLFLLSYVVALLPVVLYTGALAMEGLFDLSTVLGISNNAAIWLLVWSIGLLGATYAIFGGLKAVAISDTINGIGLLIGGLMVPLFGLLYIGDGTLTDGISTLMNSNPEKFDMVGDEDSSLPWSTLFTGMIIAQIFFWCTNQSIIQRTLGAKNLIEGQKGVLLTGFIKVLGPVIVVLPGIIAWHIFHDNLDNADAAYPTLVRTVMPDAFTGFFAAVVMGAVLSTFNSALNSAATLFSIDIYKGMLRPDAPERKLVTVGKITATVLAFAAMLVAPLMASAPGGLYLLLQALNGIFNVPILTIVFVGMVTRQIPALAAKLVLICEPLLYILCNFVLDIELHFLHMMGALALGSVLLMLLVGRLNPQPPVPQAGAAVVDTTPWALARPVSLVIGLFSLSLYLIFAGSSMPAG